MRLCLRAVSVFGAILVFRGRRKVRSFIRGRRITSTWWTWWRLRVLWVFCHSGTRLRSLSFFAGRCSTLENATQKPIGKASDYTFQFSPLWWAQYLVNFPHVLAQPSHHFVRVGLFSLWRGDHFDIDRAIVSLLCAFRIILVVARCSLRYRSRDWLVTLRCSFSRCDAVLT